LESPAEDVDRHILVGKISGIFGVKGWVRVYSYTDPPENILGYGPWLIGDGEGRSCKVVDGAVHGRGIIARLAGVDDRDKARGLIGAAIRVPRERFGESGGDEYYWSDLLGLQVTNQDGVVFGKVEDMMETGANDVMVIRGERRRLVPFVLGAVVKSVDIGAGTIVVEWDADF
jgi:16S rRNA processing protein RimM